MMSFRLLRLLRRVGCLLILLALFFQQKATGVEWVRPGINTNVPVWGVRGGLMWALPPAGFRPRGEPRGLIRLGYPILSNATYDLVNFIAVEPIVKGRKGFSELERSALDKMQGKRLWAINPTDTQSTNPVPGTLSRLTNGVEEIRMPVAVEAFENGAKVRLLIIQRSDRPDEITLKIHTEPGSAALEYCILTATMGNMARTRQLWLRNQTVSSLTLYPSHRGDGFAPHTIYGLDQLWRSPAGDLLVAVTTDEQNPAATYPFPGTRRWYYGGEKVTQYWKKAHGTYRKDIHAAVNARHTYWKSQTPIPGGVSYENFEMRERFYDGQEFTFGITRQPVAKLISE